MYDVIWWSCCWHIHASFCEKSKRLGKVELAREAVISIFVMNYMSEWVEGGWKLMHDDGVEQASVRKGDYPFENIKII